MRSRNSFFAHKLFLEQIEVVSVHRTEPHPGTLRRHKPGCTSLGNSIAHLSRYVLTSLEWSSSITSTLKKCPTQRHSATFLHWLWQHRPPGLFVKPSPERTAVVLGVLHRAKVHQVAEVFPKLNGIDLC